MMPRPILAGRTIEGAWSGKFSVQINLLFADRFYNLDRVMFLKRHGRTANGDGPFCRSESTPNRPRNEEKNSRVIMTRFYHSPAIVGKPVA